MSTLHSWRDALQRDTSLIQMHTEESLLRRCAECQFLPGIWSHKHNWLSITDCRHLWCSPWRVCVNVSYFKEVLAEVSELRLFLHRERRREKKLGRGRSGKDRFAFKLVFYWFSPVHSHMMHENTSAVPKSAEPHIVKVPQWCQCLEQIVLYFFFWWRARPLMHWGLERYPHILMSYKL